jgi:hypothetical protein
MTQSAVNGVSNQNGGEAGNIRSPASKIGWPAKRFQPQLDCHSVVNDYRVTQD